MRDKKIKHVLLNLLLVLVLLVTSISVPVQAKAATKYITIGQFIKNLLIAMEVPVASTSIDAYIDAAIEIKIVESNQFSNYSKNITRIDAAVLLNRADEQIHGVDTVDEKKYNAVKEKRISDIKKIPESKLDAAVDTMAKGIILGKFNGFYIQNRTFNPNQSISVGEAKGAINRMVNVNKRSKISPDGQLIRTTKLPKNAADFEYILACYPNNFYEMKYKYMFNSAYKDGTMKRSEYLKPEEMNDSTYKSYFMENPMKEYMDLYLEDWTAQTEKYLNLLFNVDYRTVNNKWKDSLIAMYIVPETTFDGTGKPDYLNEYITAIKKNQVVVESEIIAVEPSTFYSYDNFYIRAYVRYKITAKDINVDQNKLLCHDTFIFLENIKNGEWREGIFDIQLVQKNPYYNYGMDELFISPSTLIDDWITRQ
jgi:hypothetical protein